MGTFSIEAKNANRLIGVIGAKNVTINNLDMYSDTASTALEIVNSANVTLENLDASGTGTGAGIHIINSTGTTVSSCTAMNRIYGIWITGSDSSSNQITGNNFSNCGTGIYNDRFNEPGSGNVYINNDVSNASNWGIYIYGDNDLTISGNDFTNCANGLSFNWMNDFIFESKNYSSYNILGDVLSISHSTNVTFRDLDASGTGTGAGIHIINSTGTTVSSCTAMNRIYGIWITGSDSSSNQITGNNFSNCGTGIYNDRFNEPGSGNVYINNDVSNASNWGIYLSGNELIARENIVNESDNGIRLKNGNNCIISLNNIINCLTDAIYIENCVDCQLYENTITENNGNGIVSINSPTLRIFHNNIYGNIGWQINSDSALELSYGNEGNYWGRTCPGPLFIAGMDSNGAEVVDTFPYEAKEVWKDEIKPGCLPPPLGEISGIVYDEIDGIDGVNISLFDSGGILQQQIFSDEAGMYSFENIEQGIYTISVIIPIGYNSLTSSEVEVVVNSGETKLVDFELTRIVTVVATRTMGYWKHQVKAILSGKGNIHEPEDNILSNLDIIHSQYDIFDNIEEITGMQAILDPPKPPTMKELAIRKLMALMLNLSSLKIATYTEVSNNDTCGEAIDYIISVLNDLTATKNDLEKVKDIAKSINAGQIPLDPAQIPESIN